PRQKFLFGLGSLKEPATQQDLRQFWNSALHKMRWRGLAGERLLDLVKEVIRKGAPLPDRAGQAQLLEYHKAGGWEWGTKRAEALLSVIDQIDAGASS